ncbi:MAG: Mth938-like domain-containing protein [Gammaproteobacteria bacterium]
MKFSLADADDSYLVRAYSQGEVIINEQRHTSSVVVMPKRIIDDWPPQSFAELSADHFAILSELKPQLVILGTGDVQRFPDPALYAALLEQGLGVEVMTTPAACRTYNILASEGRRVVAALLLD